MLLAAVVPDELNQAMNTLNLAIAAGVRNVVYLSAIHADRFSNVPHFASKGAAERAIADLGIAATILRPGYFIQNEAGLKGALVEHGVYPMALGIAGTLFIDMRDLAEIAAIELLRRDANPTPLPSKTMRLMIQRFQTDGMSVDAATHAELRGMLGRPLRSYRQFAAETAAQWRAAA